MRRSSSVVIAIVRISYPGSGKRFFSSTETTDWLWGQPSILPIHSGTGELTREKRPGHEVNYHLHVVPGAWGSVVFKALRYSSDGPGIYSRWCHWIFQ